MIIAPISKLVDPLGVHSFKGSDQNKSLMLKRFGELYSRFKILTPLGNAYIFCRFIDPGGAYSGSPRPRLMANGSDMDERPDFKKSYLTIRDLKRAQRCLDRKAFFSRVKNERRLYKLILEEKSFCLHALHTFVHSWLPEKESSTRGDRTKTGDLHDYNDRLEVARTLNMKETERMNRIASIRVLPTTTEPYMI